MSEQLPWLAEQLRGLQDQGLLRDRREANASRRYKAVGRGCFGAGGTAGCVDGSGVSADGRHWTDPAPVPWPPPQRWDDHNNVFFDEVAGRYVVTTRARDWCGQSAALAAAGLPAGLAKCRGRVFV